MIVCLNSKSQAFHEASLHVHVLVVTYYCTPLISDEGNMKGCKISMSEKNMYMFLLVASFSHIGQSVNQKAVDRSR